MSIEELAPRAIVPGTVQPKSAIRAFDLEESGEVSLRSLAKRVLGNKRLIIVSNRGPVTFDRDQQGNTLTKRGSGGLVSALGALSRYAPVSWVAAAMSETDHEMALLPPQELSRNLKLRLVNIDRECFDQYLNVISNPLLWFVQHGLGNPLKEKYDQPALWKTWQQGYVRANREFARRTLEEVKGQEGTPLVVFHDYQLYLAPQFVRQERPNLTLMHFTHIPWPEAAEWSVLPGWLVKAICQSLLSCDIAGFQTNRDAWNFIKTCALYLGKISFKNVAGGGYQVSQKEGNSTLVRAYPISIDPDQLHQDLLSEETRNWKEQLQEQLAGTAQTIVRVDRVDPSKNIIAGFEAYRELLEKRPDLREKVVFLAMLVPTRESVPEYKDYREKTFALIEEINRSFGTPGWQPIRYYYGNDFRRSLAAMSLADVVLVNSLKDGMNLVAKEASVANERNFALVLSRHAGAWQELGRYSVGVEPGDVAGTARALEMALEMPGEEKARRSRGLEGVVRNNNLTGWLVRQLGDLELVKLDREKQNRIPALSGAGV